MRSSHLALLLTAATTGTALADDDASIAATSTKTKMLAVDGGIAMPTGDWSDAVGFGIGVLGRFEMPFRPNVTFTGRVGYIHHMSKDAGGGASGGGGSASASEIPVLGGVRYTFSRKPTSELYGAAELGFVMTRVSIESGGMSNSDSNTNLGMTLGGGYRTGKLDLRGGLLFPDLDHAGDAIGLMATVGYDLKAL